MIGPAPMCVYCRHFDRKDRGVVCKAFPRGIPKAILWSEYDHRKPYPGDNGIRFEPAKGEEEKAREYLAVLFPN